MFCLNDVSDIFGFYEFQTCFITEYESETYLKLISRQRQNRIFSLVKKKIKNCKPNKYISKFCK